MIKKIILGLLGNAAGLLAAAYLVKDFDVNISNWVAFASLIVVFTFVTLIIRPIIKLVLTPVIILTFGLFNLVITDGLLYIVDKYSQNLTISGLPALIYGTLLITIINIIFRLGERAGHKEL